MSDQHESAVQAWLDQNDTIREIAMVRKKVPDVSQYQAVMLALGVQILAALEVYGAAEPAPEVFPDPEDNEPWK